MKFLFSLILIFALSSTAFSQLPDVSLKTLEGKTVKLEDVVSKEKITVLNFWATWCNPCKKELDTIKDLYASWQTEYDVEFIAISIDDTRSMRKVKPMVGEKKWKYSIYLDEKQDMLKAFNFQTIPRTFVLDKNKKVVYSHNGYIAGDEIELEEQLRKLSAKK